MKRIVASENNRKTLTFGIDTLADTYQTQTLHHARLTTGKVHAHSKMHSKATVPMSIRKLQTV